MEKTNFHYIGVLLDMLYGIEMDTDELEEIGLRGWDLIGNKNTRLYSYTACINSSNGDNSIQLPCNAVSVEAVTSFQEDQNPSTNISGDYRGQYIESSIEAQKLYKSPYYISGKLLSYQQVGNTLYFKNNYGSVNVLYKGILADEEGLPEITDKEAHAIATYLAYVDKYKEGLKTNNINTINLAQNLYALWLKQCDQARVTQLSQNTMNDILNIRDSWNRHSYGYSYKPIR